MERLSPSEKKAWPMVRLGDVCEFVYGFPFDSSAFNDDSIGLPLIRIRDVVPGTTQTFTTQPAPLRYNVGNGDLLVGMDGDFNLAQWKGGPALINQRVCMFKPKAERICLGFIKYALGKYLQAIWEKKPFATVKHLSAKDLNAISLPLPPLSVQHEIVARLEKELSEADRLAANFKRIAERADDEFKAELDETFEQIKGEKMRLGEVCEIERGRSKARPRNSPDLYGGPYPFVQTGDVKGANGGVINFFAQTYSEKGLKQSRLWPKGTLCVTIAANIGETAILGFDACFPDSIVGIVPHDILEASFLNFYFAAIKNHLLETAPGTAQKNLNVERLSNIEMRMPPLTIQRAIVSKLETAKASLTKLKAAAERSLRAAGNLRAAILSEAFAP